MSNSRVFLVGRGRPSDHQTDCGTLLEYRGKRHCLSHACGEGLYILSRSQCLGSPLSLQTS